MRAEQRVRGEGAGDGSSRAATLYTRLGGSETIHAIVNDMTERVLADPRVNFQRKDVQTSWLGAEYDEWEPTPERVARFKRRMVEFIELAAGGPAEYSGRNMKVVHEGMRITNIEFDAFVGDMTASMNRLGIGTAEQRDLLAVIESTRKQIVEEP
jgi:hemoglobin